MPTQMPTDLPETTLPETTHSADSADRAGDGRHRRRGLTLGALVQGSGGHTVGWRPPLARPDGQLDIDHHIRLARTLERGTFDALLVADGADHLEPLTLLAALATVTERIGLVATATTTYNEPFHVARKLASLDHLSGGRAGWNVVTSVAPTEAGNFGHHAHPEAQLEHGARYRRAEEFLRAVRALWDSFDDDAVIRDKASGRYYDPAGLHPPHHRGDHFTVRGPLNISRPPQGHPVLLQAASSEAERDFAARHAEVVLTEQTTIEGARAFYADLKARVAAAGRDPAGVLVWPLLSPIVTSTEAEARRRLAELDELARDGAAASVVVGTPRTVADHIDRWLTGRAADGFNISFPHLPGPAEDFVDQVVPELRRRGLLRAEYTTGTLRGHLGLPRPTRLIGDHDRRPGRDHVRTEAGIR